MRTAGLRPISIVITGGTKVTREGNARHVPKRDLVGALQVLIQSSRLKAAKGLSDGQMLVHELQNFKYKISAAGNDTYAAWREGDHDDLVLAVALPVWFAQAKRVGKVL
ncbi:MAG: hypothetical protein ABIQ44_12175 [Chloroflexia bacterium]